MIEITENPIVPEAIINSINKKETYGAVVTFIGIVRGYSENKKVISLEYEAYQPLAEKKLQEIALEIENRWQLKDLAICHRTGRLQVGEPALVIAIAAPHRKEAFEACEYAVDRLKEIVPVWKKEVWEDGEKWIEG